MIWQHDRTPDGFSCWYCGKIGAIDCLYIFQHNQKYHVMPGVFFNDLETAKLFYVLSRNNI